jgi:hypothetical protein
MPSLAAFLQVILGKALGVFVSMFGAVWGIRLAAATAMASGYIACVVVFSGMVGPWFAAITTTAYGALLGLLFPPVSGTVLASLVAYWTAVITLQYTRQLWRAVTG